MFPSTLDIISLQFRVFMQFSHAGTFYTLPCLHAEPLMLQQLSFEVSLSPPSHAQLFDRDSQDTSSHTPTLHHLSDNEYLAVVDAVPVGEYSCTVYCDSRVVSTALISLHSQVVAVEVRPSVLYAGGGGGVV